MKLYIKIITGFRKDQAYSIDAEEAHKAYRIFENPDERTIFNNGLALRGDDVRMIEPDYVATMGWNPSHVLDSDDLNEIRKRGIDKKIRDIMLIAQEVARIEPTENLRLPLSEIRPLLK